MVFLLHLLPFFPAINQLPPFISCPRAPLSVKYIRLTIKRGFNGAIKPSDLTTNKLCCGIWSKWGIVMVGHQLPSRPPSTPFSSLSRQHKNVPKSKDFIRTHYIRKLKTCPRDWNLEICQLLFFSNITVHEVCWKYSCSFYISNITKWNPANHPTAVAFIWDWSRTSLGALVASASCLKLCLVTHITFSKWNPTRDQVGAKTLKYFQQRNPNVRRTGMWPDTCEKILVISPEKCENLQEEVSLNAIFHQLLHVGLFSTRKDQVVTFLDPKRAIFCTRSWGTDLDCSL